MSVFRVDESVRFHASYQSLCLVQVIVDYILLMPDILAPFENCLLSVRTIDLMKSKEGQTEEIQNLKEQLAQALIDVVHDFDASWNA